MLILEICFTTIYPANIYLFKINTKNNRKRSEICFKLRIKAPERRQLHIFIVNFEHISHPFLKFLLVTLNQKILARQKLVYSFFAHQLTGFYIVSKKVTEMLPFTQRVLTRNFTDLVVVFSTLYNINDSFFAKKNNG